MIERVGDVILNLTYYQGKDEYSDGSVEDDMLEIAKNYERYQDFAQILAQDNSWPVQYHFSPYRENLLEWYPFSEGACVLEIGSGCGGLTGALSKNTYVTCVELSKKRALISAYRHKNKKNIEIFVGNFNDMIFSAKYDYITLIGVLEYAKLYTDSPNPCLDFIKKIKPLLNKGGQLIIAIENRYGLKYWAGAKEDHTDLLFEGILGYPNRPDIVTFSKMELIELLKEAGFTETEFYYPYPDYKLPEAIYSDSWLPEAHELVCKNKDYSEGEFLFDMRLAYQGLIANGMYDFFSNSFLVIAKTSGEIR